MAVYRPVRHQKNIIWTSEASFHIIFFWWRTCPYIYCHMTLSAMNYLIIPFCLFSYMDVKYGAISILLTARFRNESIPLDTVYSKIECEKLQPLRNCIKNEAVQSRLYSPAALTRTNRENKNVKCNILYVLFSCFWPDCA
jgi:hypothetical protein